MANRVTPPGGERVMPPPPGAPAGRCRTQTLAGLRAMRGVAAWYANRNKGRGLGRRASMGCLGWLLVGWVWFLLPLTIFVVGEVAAAAWTLAWACAWGVAGIVAALGGRRGRRASPPA